MVDKSRRHTAKDQRSPLRVSILAGMPFRLGTKFNVLSLMIVVLYIKMSPATHTSLAIDREGSRDRNLARSSYLRLHMFGTSMTRSCGALHRFVLHRKPEPQNFQLVTPGTNWVLAGLLAAASGLGPLGLFQPFSCVSRWSLL